MHAAHAPLLQTCEQQSVPASHDSPVARHSAHVRPRAALVHVSPAQHCASDVQGAPPAVHCDAGAPQNEPASPASLAREHTPLQHSSGSEHRVPFPAQPAHAPPLHAAQPESHPGARPSTLPVASPAAPSPPPPPSPRDPSTPKPAVASASDGASSEQLVSAPPASSDRPVRAMATRRIAMNCTPRRVGAHVAREGLPPRPCAMTRA